MKDLRCRYFNDEDGNTKSMTQICKGQSKNKDLVNNRLKYGYSLNDALNKPKNVTKQGKPIVVDRILYNSVAMALRKLNMEDKESKVRRRLKKGMSPDFAFEKKKKTRIDKMKVKIVVNKMPTVDTDCPFAIQCPNDKNYPCVCELKRDKANMFGLNFSHHQYSNCNLSKGNPCNMLTEQMLINKV